MLRFNTTYVTTLANANEQLFKLDTFDEYRTRHIKTVFCGIATAGVQLAFYVSGQRYGGIDCTRFAAGDAVLHIEIDVPAKMDITVGVTNLAAGVLTNVPIVIGYEVDPGSGP